MKSKDDSGRTAKTLALALLCAFALSCASNRNIDAKEFAVGSGADAGTPVAWKGTFLDIKHISPAEDRNRVRVGASPRWTLSFRIIESNPRIPPFVPGKRVSFTVEDPLSFFLTNDFSVGQSIDKVLMVWKSPDGALNAVER